MAAKKVSVFVVVIALHAVVIGVVYLSTRTDEPESDKNPIESPGTKGKTTKTDPLKKDPVTTPSNTTPVPVDKPPVNNTNTKHIIHVVAKGDFLGKIAAKYKVSSKAIMALNDMKDPNKIRLGQKLKVPVK